MTENYAKPFCLFVGFTASIKVLPYVIVFFVLLNRNKITLAFLRMPVPQEGSREQCSPKMIFGHQNSFNLYYRSFFVREQPLTTFGDLNPTQKFFKIVKGQIALDMHWSAQLLRHRFRCKNGGVRFLGRSNRKQYRLATAATFLRSCVSQVLSLQDGPNHSLHTTA